MSEKTKKQFGVWMDTQQATIVGHNPAATEFTVIGHAKNPGTGTHKHDNASNNHEITLTRLFFKEIGTHMENAEEIHVTGTGTIQEQFLRYLGDTPQFKKTITSESTSNKMTDEKLIAFVSSHFN